MLEEKFQNEMETSRKCAEIQSQLILERNMKTTLESELRRLTSENQTLNERIRFLDDLEMDKKRLRNNVELLEKEKAELSEQLDRNKRTSTEVTCAWNNTGGQPSDMYSLLAIRDRVERKGNESL